MYYPRFRGTPSIINEYINRKNERYEEINDSETYFQLPRPLNEENDIVEILKEMSLDNWDIRILPQYEVYEHYMWKEYDMKKNQLQMDHEQILDSMKENGWNINLLNIPPSWTRTAYSLGSRP